MAEFKGAERIPDCEGVVSLTGFVYEYAVSRLPNLICIAEEQCSVPNIVRSCRVNAQCRLLNLHNK